MKPGLLLQVVILSLWFSQPARPASFDAAPFGLPLPEGNGIFWEDPREIHRVVVHFTTAPSAPEKVRLEYWGSRWPEQHLPKDREPGGGDVGWMELGNWYRGGWRVADTQVTAGGSTLAFSFRRVNAKEFPRLKDYAADFRYTLKLRVVSTDPLPKISRIETLTDSKVAERSVQLAWKESTRRQFKVEAVNGEMISCENTSLRSVARLIVAANLDPNSFDRTLLTIHNGSDVFTIRVDDLAFGPLFLPEYGVAAFGEGPPETYAALAVERNAHRSESLYDRVSRLPEQTWEAAWQGMPAKKSHIYFPLGLDGGRQRFLLQADGTARWRLNDNFLEARPGQDTPRLKLEAAPVRLSFGTLGEPLSRCLEQGTLPICESTWENTGVAVTQTAFLTELDGTKATGPVPAADASAVFLAQFVFSNSSAVPQTARLPISYSAGEASQLLRSDPAGFLWRGNYCRGQIIADGVPKEESHGQIWSWPLKPGESRTVVIKLPYVLLNQPGEVEALARLTFNTERAAVADYWQRRLNQSARLITPEPILDDFYRADAGHLLVNCEREPGSTRRFARVGSFSYGAYGNESCMMVVDLDRRGYHREAQECLDAWLHYQGTVELPGDFESKQGILYGAGGYESGGYNQHHGWILWCLAEHYRFTRDQAWLRTAAPGILAGADWIVRESKRTDSRLPLERGLLPAGSLEDIGDWWTWLSTSCYTWRGLDSAAWVLEQIHHSEAKRIRQQADAFHSHLLANFRAAAQRSPVVRLRDGTAVPHFPSQVHRRGRSFGWICETLEGALHLLITGALDPHSPEAAWILKDYEDNLYLSNQYGYVLDDFDKYWFGRGGMSMQACLLLEVEPFLRRDDVKQALRATFNAIAVSHFADVHMNTEHALPQMGDWRGDHFKSSDESNACGWLRQLFVNESGEQLLLGQAVPREWLAPGRRCGIERAATYFGQTSVLYAGARGEISATIGGPTRNPPRQIRLRFRTPGERPLRSVSVNGKTWKRFTGDWVELPGDIGKAQVLARY
jgi:hypothetical protein